MGYLLMHQHHKQTTNLCRSNLEAERPSLDKYVPALAFSTSFEAWARARGNVFIFNTEQEARDFLAQERTK